MTHDEALAVRDRIAQALPGHRVDVIDEWLADSARGEPVLAACIRIDDFWLLSSPDPLGSVRAIFGVEVHR